MLLKESELLEKITNILSEGNITSKEQRILSKAKLDLEHQMYLPKVVAFLESELTPIAIKAKLSGNVSQLYLTITSHRFKDKGGAGIITSLGRLF
ncbi:bacteriocin immunity protein [Streptococcus oricebi]|uniref:Bacteriocin immunity protein n=1 Tax=Streptococcus oricebi TaxID=1547447 RepID=A0ABS5B2X4_9STRE|nr:bacteriocin immunity protein [Streptococcus oricebi]